MSFGVGDRGSCKEFRDDDELLDDDCGGWVAPWTSVMASMMMRTERTMLYCMTARHDGFSLWKAWSQIIRHCSYRTTNKHPHVSSALAGSSSAW